MKKINFLKWALVLAALLLTTTACNKGELKGYKKTKKGLHYKFHVKGDGEAVEKGDILIAEIWQYLGDTLLGSNEGNPTMVARAEDNMFDGDLPEGLLMMHVGDSASFAIPLDSIKKLNPGMEDIQHKYLKVTIKLHDLKKNAEVEAEEKVRQAEMDSIAAIDGAKETKAIAEYVKKNNVKVSPNADGVYVIVKTTGKGNVIAQGSDVRMHYVGKFLDGKIFDTSLEKEAKAGKIHQEGRDYQPLPFQAGSQQMIRGLDNALIGHTEGTKLTLIIPSEAAYGANGNYTIPGFTPLVFDVEVISVK